MQRIIVKDIDELMENIIVDIYETIMMEHNHMWFRNRKQEIPSYEDIENHIYDSIVRLYDEDLSKLYSGGFVFKKQDNNIDIEYQFDNFLVQQFFEIKEEQEIIEDNDKEMVEIEIELSDEIFLELSKIAHECDITFNELCNDILKEQLKDIENEELD